MDDQQETPLNQPTSLPKAPNPSTDPGVIPHINKELINCDNVIVKGKDLDVERLSPIAALTILSQGVQTLVELTGDVPPSPAVSRPNTPPPPALRNDGATRSRNHSRPSTPPSRVPSDDITGLVNKSPIGGPEVTFSEPDVVGVRAAADRVQYETVARKFYSKKPPPITIFDYISRMHRYCPMSPGVYLAAGAYIYQLAVEEKLVPVTQRTVHRLLLASLRVAMKALEDLSYPHKRFAGVGGVSEPELAKLEVALCYLMDFNLRLDLRTMQERARALNQLGVADALNTTEDMGLFLPVRARTFGKGIAC